jgi:hypothetical protein
MHLLVLGSPPCLPCTSLVLGLLLATSDLAYVTMSIGFGYGFWFGEVNSPLMLGS